MSKEAPGVRYAEIEQETSRCRVRVVLDLDGERKSTVDTGIPFFDFLLEVFTESGGFDLGVSAEGDLALGDRHTVEDVGGCIGRAIRQALGSSAGIRGHGCEVAGVQDALVMSVLELNRSPYLHYVSPFTCERLGGLSVECVEVFLRELSQWGEMSLHVKKWEGYNNHNIAEALFISLGRALGSAVRKVESK